MIIKDILIMKKLVLILLFEIVLTFRLYSAIDTVDLYKQQLSQPASIEAKTYLELVDSCKFKLEILIHNVGDDVMSVRKASVGYQHKEVEESLYVFDVSKDRFKPLFNDVPPDSVISNDHLILAPGEKLRAKVDLGNMYLLESGKMYEITFYTFARYGSGFITLKSNTLKLKNRQVIKVTHKLTEPLKDTY